MFWAAAVFAILAGLCLAMAQVDEPPPPVHYEPFFSAEEWQRYEPAFREHFRELR